LRNGEVQETKPRCARAVHVMPEITESGTASAALFARSRGRIATPVEIKRQTAGLCSAIVPRRDKFNRSRRLTDHADQASYARLCFCCSDRRPCFGRGPFHPRGTKGEAAASGTVGEWHSNPAHAHDHPQSRWQHDRHYRGPTLVSRSGNGCAFRLPWY